MPKSSAALHQRAPAETPDAWKYFKRAMLLKCPECGVSPMFVPLRRTKSIADWFQPLDGCPRCGYAYEREQGYFLIATWVFNYGVVGGIGLTCGLLADIVWKASLPLMFVAIAVPMAIASLLLARHTK